jgi:riboflavin transporter FmnP
MVAVKICHPMLIGLVILGVLVAAALTLLRELLLEVLAHRVKGLLAGKVLEALTGLVVAEEAHPLLAHKTQLRI